MDVFTIITTIFNTMLALVSSIFTFLTYKKTQNIDEQLKDAQNLAFQKTKFDTKRQELLRKVNEYISELDNAESIPHNKLFYYRSLANTFISADRLFSKKDYDKIEKIFGEFDKWANDETIEVLQGHALYLCKTYLDDLKNILEMKVGNI